jgi:hypothetical protein
MPSVKLIASPQGTTLPLALLRVYAPDTLSCKRMELAICSEGNGTYGQLDPGERREY